MTRPLGKTVNLSEATLLGIPKLTFPAHKRTRFNAPVPVVVLKRKTAFSLLARRDTGGIVRAALSNARLICLCGNLAARTMIYAAIVSPRRPFSYALRPPPRPSGDRNALMRAPPRYTAAALEQTSSRYFSTTTVTVLHQTRREKKGVGAIRSRGIRSFTTTSLLI